MLKWLCIFTFILFCLLGILESAYANKIVKLESRVQILEQQNQTSSDSNVVYLTQYIVEGGEDCFGCPRILYDENNNWIGSLSCPEDCPVLIEMIETDSIIEPIKFTLTVY